MNTIKFKTNIMCSDCIAKVTPVLNEAFGENNWKVDIKDSKKILTVSTENADKDDVIKTLEKTGYKAEVLV